MNFEWTDQDLQRIERSRKFAEQELTSSKAKSRFPKEMWDACAREGLLGLPLPADWGGQDLSLLSTVGVFEALGRGGADRGLLFAIGAHLFGCAMAVSKYGRDDQRDQYLGRMANGETIAALAMTEPQCGSSVSKMETIAEQKTDGYLLDGTKTFVTNGSDASVFLVIASEEPKRKSMGLTAFLVPADSPGLRTEALPASGMPLAPMARVQFDQCRVSQNCVLGRCGGGYAVLLSSMQYERTAILSGFLGAAELDLVRCVDRMKERIDHQGPLLGYQAVSHRLAKMQCRIETARWLLYRGAWAVDHGQDATLWPAIVKYTVSETIVKCALDVLRIFAGDGWLDEFGSASALNDVIGTLSASGTSETQLNVVVSGLAKGMR